MLTRRMVLTAAIAAPAAALFSRPAMADHPAVFAEEGIALRGADPVGYFIQGRTVIGDADQAVLWRGATWHFASAENMELFMANPNAYAPQYGGYCALAMCGGTLASTTPEAWTIRGDKLYMNYSVNVREYWSQDVAVNIALANGHWPTALG